MTDVLTDIFQKKKLLESYKSLPKNVLKNLEEWYRVELTYTSNAIEADAGAVSLTR